MSQVGKAAPSPAAHPDFLGNLGAFFSDLAHEATDEVKAIAAKVVPGLEEVGKEVENAVIVDAERLGEMAMASVLAEAVATNKTPTEKFNDAVMAVKQTLTVEGKSASSGLVNIAVEGAYQTMKTIGQKVAADLAGAAGN